MVVEYLLIQQRDCLHVKASDITEELGLPPGSCARISHFLKKACFARNNLGFHVAALHSNPDGKIYSITLRETFDKISQKVLDD